MIKKIPKGVKFRLDNKTFIKIDPIIDKYDNLLIAMDLLGNCYDDVYFQDKEIEILPGLVVEDNDERFIIENNKVYATKKILVGETIEVLGILVDLAEYTNICTSYANNYKFAAEPHQQLRFVVIPIGFASLIQEAYSHESQNVTLCHRDIISPDNVFSNRVIYKVIKQINPGDEVLAFNKKNNPDEIKKWKELVFKNIYGLSKLLD